MAAFIYLLFWSAVELRNSPCHWVPSVGQAGALVAWGRVQRLGVVGSQGDARPGVDALSIGLWGS